MSASPNIHDRATDPSPEFPWLVEDDDGVTLYVLTQPDAVENRYMGVDGKFLKFKSAPEQEFLG